MIVPTSLMNWKEESKEFQMSALQAFFWLGIESAFSKDIGRQIKQDACNSTSVEVLEEVVSLGMQRAAQQQRLKHSVPDGESAEVPTVPCSSQPL
jgi:hypothetical protein